MVTFIFIVTVSAVMISCLMVDRKRKLEREQEREHYRKVTYGKGKFTFRAESKPASGNHRLN